jgi:Domain of unknown function (DUF2828)
VLSNNLPPKEVAVILRSFYQCWVLTSLRKASSLPEPLMATKQWKEIKYSCVASVCMKNNTENFFKHDPDSFQAYLLSIEKGKKSISGTTLFPHELVMQSVKLGEDQEHTKSKYPAIMEYHRSLAETQMRVVEAQWKMLIENLHESGTIENTLAVCDVSGSMGSLFCARGKGPVELIAPAIALLLVLASLTKPPFNSGFITFSSSPSYVHLDLEKSLCDTVIGMYEADWGMNTDLNVVFMKLLLPLAKEDMIKHLFMFTDMQFDDAGSGWAMTMMKGNAVVWEMNYDLIERVYKEAGYDVLQIVLGFECALGDGRGAGG